MEIMSRSLTFALSTWFALCLFSGTQAGAQMMTRPDALSPGPLAPGLLPFGPTDREPEGGVSVVGWVEDGADGPVLRVAVTPEGDARLVTDPGIVATPVSRPGLAFETPLPATLTEPGTGYWTETRYLDLPFARRDGRPIALEVDYAWCLVDAQCFYGRKSLTVATRAP